jgi:hypothetical protein
VLGEFPTLWRWLAGAGCSSAELVVAGVVVSEAVGVAVEVKYDGAVQEPVKQGGGDGGVVEDVAPRRRRRGRW